MIKKCEIIALQLRENTWKFYYGMHNDPFLSSSYRWVHSIVKDEMLSKSHKHFFPDM